MEPEVRVFISAMLAIAILATVMLATPIVSGVLLPIKACPDYSENTCGTRSECVWDAESNFCDYNQNVMYYETMYKEQGLIQAAVMILLAIVILLVGKFVKSNALIKNTLAITAAIIIIYAVMLGAMILIPNVTLTIALLLIVLFWFVALKATTPKTVARALPKKKSKK